MRRVVLLRAVNLGGRNTVSMKTWAARLEALGCSDVTTYLQSGQAVLSSDLDPHLLAEQVRLDLADGFGVETPVLVRTPQQVRAVLDGCPWPQHAEAEPTQVHVAFRDCDAPRPWWREDPDRYAPERSVDGPGCTYLLFPGGAGRARMPPDRGGDATARNWRTVRALADLLGR